MGPRVASQYLTYGLELESVGFGNLPDAVASGAPSEKLGHLFLANNSARMALSALLSPLFDLVVHVLSARSEKQMRWVHAAGVIALVQNTEVARTGSGAELPRHTVGVLHSSRLRAPDLTVAHSVAIRGPCPAWAKLGRVPRNWSALVNLAPEASSENLGSQNRCLARRLFGVPTQAQATPGRPPAAILRSPVEKLERSALRLAALHTHLGQGYAASVHELTPRGPDPRTCQSVAGVTVNMRIARAACKSRAGESSISRESIRERNPGPWKWIEPLPEVRIL